jgi:hypothetical protein
MELRERVFNPALLRLGSMAAIGGVVAALISTIIDPGMPEGPEEAIRKASGSSLLTFSRLLDMAAFLLLLVAVAVVTQTFSREPARGWARAGLALFVVSAGAGAIATMVVGALTDVADAWAEAPTGLKAGYVAAFDALDNASGAVFAVSWAALGLFGLLYAAAILRDGFFPRWLGWVSAASAAAVIAAIVLGVGLQVDVAFVLLLFGLLLSYVVIVTFAVTLWRLTRKRPSSADRQKPASSDSGSW